jgi:phosphatidylserine/phosphatidylglycerophosphate/cardiolipin synthase-like enzyme
MRLPSRTRPWLLAGTTSVVACSAGHTPTSGSGAATSRAATMPSSTYVGDAVIAALQQYPSMQGITWNVTQDNVLDSQWLLNSPLQPMWGQSLSSLVYPQACSGNCDPDFSLQLCTSQSDCTGGGTCTAAVSSVKSPGQTPVSMCVGHSFGMVERFYGLITSARQFVDITSLSPADGQYRAAVRNAITYLSTQPQPPQVRILTSDVPGTYDVSTDTEVAAYTRDVSSGSAIQVAVGTVRTSDTQLSWNHAKIVAVDGKAAIVGGHNMYSTDYLGADPVNDTSMRVTGSAAVDAHHFANQLWAYLCNTNSSITQFSGSAQLSHWSAGVVSRTCPTPYQLQAAPGTGNTRIIAVGRLGTGILDGGNQADVARIALIDTARTAIRITQQDIGPPSLPVLGVHVTGWPTDELEAIADALARGVDVYIIVSDLNAKAGVTGSVYSNGWTATDVGNQIEDYMQNGAGYPTGAALGQLLCSKLHLAPFRYGSDATWPDGATFANHSKVIQVDAEAVYISSFNMYPANLQEFGYIVDDPGITSQWLNQYWLDAWAGASTGAVSGPEAATCMLGTTGASSGSDAGVGDDAAGDDAAGDGGAGDSLDGGGNDDSGDGDDGADGE